MESGSTWRDIRALRSAPPGLAAENKGRRRVFSAAQQQAEELHQAAANCGPSSRPLPLFYALSQGGRAIAAAKAPDPDWQPSGHGLVARYGSDAVLAARVSPKGAGTFQMVAAATGSPALAGAPTLGAFLASLPELSNAAALADHPTAIRLELEYESVLGEHSILVPPYGSLAIYCGPEASLAGDRHMEAMLARLEPYEGAAGWGIVPSIRSSAGRPCIALTWQFEDEEGRRGYKTLDSIATGAGDAFYIRRSLGAGGTEVSILMSWWATLLGLSSLARYEPARWQAALDVDSSEVAVLLERVLEVAQRRIPELLHEALTANG
jgi:hypothetical protein